MRQQRVRARLEELAAAEQAAANDTDALALVRRQQSRALSMTHQDMDVTDAPIGTLALVLPADGDEYVITRREDGWHRVGQDDGPLQLSSAVGATDENPLGWQYQRLYTPEEVDDLLDHFDVEI